MQIFRLVRIFFTKVEKIFDGYILANQHLLQAAGAN